MLFLYSWSSFFRRESASLRFALLIIEAMALLHRAGMSSSLGGLERWSRASAWLCVCVYVCVCVCVYVCVCVCVCLVCWESVLLTLLVLGLESMLSAVFLSHVMRLYYLVSDFVMGGCILVFVYLAGR